MRIGQSALCQVSQQVCEKGERKREREGKAAWEWERQRRGTRRRPGKGCKEEGGGAQVTGGSGEKKRKGAVNVTK